MRAPPTLQNRSIKRQAKRNSTADLRMRFLELQRLRELVRIAECGRLTAPADSAGRGRPRIYRNIFQDTDPGAGPH